MLGVALGLAGGIGIGRWLLRAAPPAVAPANANAILNGGVEDEGPAPPSDAELEGQALIDDLHRQQEEVERRYRRLRVELEAAGDVEESVRERQRDALLRKKASELSALASKISKARRAERDRRRQLAWERAEGVQRRRWLLGKDAAVRIQARFRGRSVRRRLQAEEEERRRRIQAEEERRALEVEEERRCSERRLRAEEARRALEAGEEWRRLERRRQRQAARRTSAAQRTTRLEEQRQQAEQARGEEEEERIQQERNKEESRDELRCGDDASEMELEEFVEHMRIFGIEELEGSDPPMCDEDGCCRKACCELRSNLDPDNPYRKCLDHREDYFDPFDTVDPQDLPINHLSEADKQAITDHCTHQSDPALPNLPTSPAPLVHPDCLEDEEDDIEDEEDEDEEHTATKKQKTSTGTSTTATSGTRRLVKRKKRRVDVIPALVSSKVPPGIDACVGKKPQRDTRSRWLCRLPGCDKRGQGKPTDYFCHEHYRTYATDQSQWTLPPTLELFEAPTKITVPPTVDARVGKAPKRVPRDIGSGTKMLCRFAECDRIKCDKYNQYEEYDYCCRGCHTRFSTVNLNFLREMEKLHAEKVALGNTLDATLRQFLFGQSHNAATDGDADVHMANLECLFHFTAAPSLKHWELSTAGEIVLKPNACLKSTTLTRHTPHWKKMPREKRESRDNKIWGSTSFLGGYKFIGGHHKCPPKEGTVWHCFVITPSNPAYKTFSQFRFDGVNISDKHQCMVESVGRDVVPCLVLRIEFVDREIGNAKMTVVRVNGDGAKEVSIDAEHPGFDITKENITWSK